MLFLENADLRGESPKYANVDADKLAAVVSPSQKQ